MVRALAAAIRRGGPDAGWLLRELLARLPARWAGAGPRLSWERARTLLGRVLAATPVAPEETRWRGYAAAQESMVRATQLREILGQNGWPPPPRDGARNIAADALGEVLAGVHGLESRESQRFRWTEPVAVLCLPLPAEGAVLRIDTGGLRGAPLGYLHGIYADGTPLAADRVSADERVIEARLGPDIARAAAEGGIVLASRPLLPRRFGSSDRRRLGMPIVELELSALPAVVGESRARSMAHA
jgi:hypothetical protein